MSDADAVCTSVLDDGVLRITMDDGKANALSLAMLGALHAALDHAEAEGAAVLIAGRPERFSAGFDLNVLRARGADALPMLRSGFELAARLLVHPAPVVLACTGHAVAMGCFLLTAADYRVGTEGDYRITANEVALGLTMPYTAIELCRQRLTPSYHHRALALAEVFSPDRAVDAGFLDEAVTPDEVVGTALAKARELAALDRSAHAATKRRMRGGAAEAVRAAIDVEFPPAH